MKKSKWKGVLGVRGVPLETKGLVCGREVFFGEKGKGGESGIVRIKARSYGKWVHL